MDKRSNRLKITKIVCIDRSCRWNTEEKKGTETNFPKSFLLFNVEKVREFMFYAKK